MESLLSELSRHAYGILFLIALLESIGLPVPAAVALILAGGAAARGVISLPLAAATAIGAMMLGDVLMFLLGRFTGWWLLGVLCRLSLNPESCILRSADSFYRRGRLLLVVAKFMPGINTMAPPLAGSMNMRATQFLLLDLAGAALYVGAWLAAGFAFSGAIEMLVRGYRVVGQAVSIVLAASLLAYLGVQVWMWRKARALRSVPSVSPAEADRAFLAGEALLYDVRSHGYYDRDAVRIRGSLRMDPHAVHHWHDDLPPDRNLYVYCTCIRQATSARVMDTLLKKGLRGAVIEGGLRAWKKAGLPLEPVPAEEMAALPLFD